MRNILFNLFILCNVYSIFAQPSKGSVFIGYGTHKFVLRGEFKLSDKWIKVENSSTRLYFDLGYDWNKFKNDRFVFEGNTYSSKVWMLAIGLGIGQEFIIKDFFIVQPYLGLFYKFARFKDKELVEEIADNNLQRLYNGKEVGKLVKNGYGNLVTVDFGSRIGFRIKRRFELGGSIGISPSRYSSANSLFGKYWAEKPYTNEYYIKRIIFKADIGFKVNF